MRKPCLVSVFVGLSFLTLHAQDMHYVVIGTFAQKENAARFSKRITRPDVKPQTDFNASKNVHYVYLFPSANAGQAETDLARVKVVYRDAWIYHGKLGNQPVAAAPVQQPAPPPVERRVEPEKPVVQEKPAVQEKPKETVVPPPVAKSDPVTPTPSGKPFFFKLVSEQTGNPIAGEIQVAENAKATEFIAFQSNQVVYISVPPKNKQGTYHVKTLAPGYKALKRSISYTDPANSAASIGPLNEFVIALPLIPVKTGDYIEFANVRFFANSAVLQPDSKVELNALAALLREHQSYHVTVHGHCNGDESRDISSPAPNADLFTTGATNVRETADSKKFTLLRAETVKAYLVQEGIDASRIKTKGDGGKNIIYPKNSTMSARNDRVEVEVKSAKPSKDVKVDVEVKN